MRPPKIINVTKVISYHVDNMVELIAENEDMDQKDVTLEQVMEHLALYVDEDFNTATDYLVYTDEDGNTITND